MLCNYSRIAFLQILDEKRGRFSTLNPLSFEYMTVAMKVFLDKCIDPRRVKCALRLANMSITFHKTIPRDTEEGGAGSQLSEEDSRHYVQREAAINQHELWHTVGFWDDALSHGLREQIAMMEPVQWDELEPDILKEKVTGMLVSDSEVITVLSLCVRCVFLVCFFFLTMIYPFIYSFLTCSLL
jgi:hypothetical protein